MVQANSPASDESRGRATLSEIVSQPDTWAAAYAMLHARQADLAAAWNAHAPRQVLVTGCGSTYYLALSAAALLQGVGRVPARGVPASEIVLYPEQVIHDAGSTLLITVSRSGTTTETAAAIDRFRSLGGKAVWGITCHAGTPVADESDTVILTDMAQERSTAQTRSFSTMLLAAQALAALVGKQSLEPLASIPDVGRRLIEGTYGLATNWGTEAGIERFFFLGSGWLYGIACEAMLKMKEMSVSHSEAYHFLEFRHGPKALVDDEAMVIGLVSAQTMAHEAAVIREMVELGGNTVILAPGQQAIGHVAVHLPASAPAWTLPGLYLPVLQSMAYARAMHKGLDPDNPRNLTAVVQLDRKSFTE